MTNTARLAFVFSAAVCLCSATETKTWTSAEYSDFSKGDLKKLSISSDGRVRLAPAFDEVLDTSSIYLWALAEDSKGNLYAGGGGPGGPGARVYIIPPAGKGKTLAQLDDLEVHAIAVDAKDRVYAATSPDGKVYRINGAGKPEVFFDPKAKYIWGMTFDSRGDLFVATGDRGEIYRVTPDGKGKVFYKTSETHARSIAVDDKDNLIVGTEPGGLIVRVSSKGDAFVLYQAAKREITSVAVSKDGAIYAAGVGNKERSTAVTPSGPALPVPAPTPAVQPGAAEQPGRQMGSRGAGQTAAPSLSAGPPAPIAGGSEVYRIDKDGYPHRVWSHTQNVAYAIGFDAENRPLIGTGNKGIVYRIDSNLIYTELLNAPPTQVTALLASRSGRVYAATGNVGKVYRIGPGLEKEGTLESDVFDAGMFTYWGRLSFNGLGNSGQIALETRSGNLDRPQNDWSPWSKAITSPMGERVTSPPARFLQWRASLRSSAAGASPELHSVDVAYVAKNVAPEVTQIEVTPPNYRFPPPSPLTPPTSSTISLPPLGRAARPTVSLLSTDAGGGSMQYAKGWVGARWTASDENADTLVYSVQIKGENESEWKPLKERISEKHYAWDSTAFPDGDYRIRVIASDSPSNPPTESLKGVLVSDPFTIDNTPPAISALAATTAQNKLTIRWHAADALSVVDKAEYSVDGGDWTLVQPTTGLSDSREEDYVLTIDRPEGAEHTIAVRVTDDYDNAGVAKVVVR